MAFKVLSVKKENKRLEKTEWEGYLFFRQTPVCSFAIPFFKKSEHTASDVLTSLCVPVLPFITNLVTLPLYAGL